MNYLEWNNAIISYYFNIDNSEKEVVLYFSEVVIYEIGSNNFPNPKDGYIEDFYNALRNGIRAIDNTNYIDRILELNNLHLNHRESLEGIPIKFPSYLTYMLSLTLPFTSGKKAGDFRLNNFHDIAKEFFREKQLCFEYDRIVKHDLTRIDFLWQEISNYLINVQNFGFGFIENIEPPVNYKFVGKYLHHVLFRREQEEKLTKVFDKENILPGDNLDRIKIKNLLINNKLFLNLKQTTVKAISEENSFVGKKIIDRVLIFYKNWDGTEYSDLNNFESRGFSRNRLVLCLDFNKLKLEIKYKYLRIVSLKEYPDEIELTYNDKKLPENIYQVYKEYSSPIKDVFIDLNTDIELKSNALRWKFNWNKDKFYLFKKEQIRFNEWVQIFKVQPNQGPVILICRKDYYSTINQNNWLTQFGTRCKVFINNKVSNLDSDWILISFDNILEFPHPSILELKLEENEKKEIVFNTAFYYNGCFYKDRLPEITISNRLIPEPLFAKYKDGSIIEFENVDNKYVFLDTHKIKIGLEFKLESGGIESKLFYKIIGFEAVNTNNIEILLPRRDSVGQITNEEANFCKGLELFLSEDKSKNFLNRQLPVTGSTFCNTIKAEKYNGNADYNIDHKGNLLLHLISSRAKLKVKDFNNAVFDLIEENTDNIKKRATYLRYQLQNLGYIDYDSNESVIVVNKPQILIKPTSSGTTLILTGARDPQLVKNIVAKSRIENSGIKIDIKNQDDLLLPQIINIKFKTFNHNSIECFAKELKLLFKKNGLNSQYALCTFFDNIDNWQQIIKPVNNSIKDIEGGEFFSIKTLKFIEKDDVFDKKLAFIRFTNINGYKTIYRLWYQETVYDMKDQQFGIYLFLFLYNKTIRDENNDSVCNKDAHYKNGVKYIVRTTHKVSNILVYDRTRKYLAIPIHCELPRYLTMSITLLSGKMPVIRKLEFEGVNYNGYYLVYKNITELFAINMISHKLKQTLLEKMLII
jgi:hypothetical protein